MQDSFIQQNMARSQISSDLKLRMKDEPDRKYFKVVIEFNQDFPGGLQRARSLLIRAYTYRSKEPQIGLTLAFPMPDDEKIVSHLIDEFSDNDLIMVRKSLWTDNYIFASLSRDTINRLSKWTFEKLRLVHKIWSDHRLERCVYESTRTIKCDAARASFAAAGKGIVWAVADTGVDGTHPHFQALETLTVPNGLDHIDFTEQHPSANTSKALTDLDGHGTHVAGIIAGRTVLSNEPPDAITSIWITLNEHGDDGTVTPGKRLFKEEISGLAPYCKILSLKVLEDSKNGDTSNLLAAIGYIQRMNDYGRSIKIHGLNLSLGYNFNPTWYAAGKSPLCIEVDRLVKSGVCVVVAAGNSGYGTATQYDGNAERSSHLGTIMDPGNAALAITVGSTHRDRPHTYGVSYFSSKGPTADGRMKPDIVAPGERIISCDAKLKGQNEAYFKEDTGTSMAAPHVSGAIAAFLSVRSEFQGEPERVKELFVAAATDLKRRPEYQGAGLIDLMRTLQSV